MVTRSNTSYLEGDGSHLRTSNIFVTWFITTMRHFSYVKVVKVANDILFFVVGPSPELEGFTALGSYGT